MNKTKKEKTRYYSLDILRLLSMLMVVVLHYCTFGYQITKVGTPGYNSYPLWIVYAFCYGAVNLYVLIRGFFLSESEFKWKKVFKLWAQVFFYSIIIGGIFYFNNLYEFQSIKDYLCVFLPFISKTYWFFTIYTVMYVLSPYLNKLTHTLSQKEFKKLLIVAGIIIIVLNEFIPGTHLIDNTYGYGIIWFLYLFLLASYIRMYDLPKIKNIYYLLIHIVGSLGAFLSRFIILKYLSETDLFKNQINMFYNYNTIFIFMASVGLFMFFKNIKLKEIFPKTIETVSKATFGVYLIHENFLVRSVLYTKVLKVMSFAKKPLLIKGSAMIGSVLAVFIVCIIIDLMRERLFRRVGL